MKKLPVLDTESPAFPLAAEGDDLVSRRGFISAATWSVLGLALASACGGGGGADGPTGPGPNPGGGGPPAPAGVTFSGNVLTVPISSVPQLASAGGFRVIGSVGGAAVNVIIINVAGTHRAFTSICTHEGCTVDNFNGQRMQCPCHGSEYDTSGRNVAGPAPRPLVEYATSFNAATQVITVTKS